MKTRSEQESIDISQFSARNTTDYFALQVFKLQDEEAAARKRKELEFAPLKTDCRADFRNMSTAQDIIINASALEEEWIRTGGASAECIRVMLKQAKEELLYRLEDNRIQPSPQIEAFFMKRRTTSCFGSFFQTDSTKQYQRWLLHKDDPVQSRATCGDCGGCPDCSGIGFASCGDCNF